MISEIIDRITGKDIGGLTYGDLDNMTFRNKFSNYLPWVAYDPETKLYQNIDNTIGYAWECSPVCFAGEQITETLSGLFRSGFPNGSVMQFVFFADPDISNHLGAMLQGREEDPLSQRSILSLSSFLQKGAEKGLDCMSNVPIRNFRLFVTVKMPMDSKAPLADIYHTCSEILRGAYLYPDDLTPSGLVAFTRKFINKSDTLNYYNYNENIPIRKQIIFSDTEISKSFNGMKIGENYFKCLTPKVFPKEVNTSMLNNIFGGTGGLRSDNDQIKTPFIYSLNIVFDDVKRMINAKAGVILYQQTAATLSPSLGRKKEEFIWAVDELEKGKRFLRVVPSLWVYDKDEDNVVQSAKRVKRIWEAEGFVMQEDRGILPILFISTLPFGLYNVGKNLENLERDFIIPEGAVATLLPIQGDFAGGGNPILSFVGRKGQYCGLDIFSKSANNHNMMIAATTGSGKSFLINYIAFNYLTKGAYVRIIDIGASYKKLCNIMGGKYLVFSKDSNVCLNPFTHIKGDTEDISASLNVCASMIFQMIYSATGKVSSDVAELSMTLCKNAVNWSYEEEDNAASVDTVFNYLEQFPKHAREFAEVESTKAIEQLTFQAHTMAYNIKEFTSEGQYGRWFNGPSSLDIAHDRFVVLELEHLKQHRELFKIITNMVVNEVTSDLYLSDRNNPRLIIFEESSQFLSANLNTDNETVKAVIEEGYRRARKYNGSFSTVLQSILDKKQFGGVGEVIFSNSAFKFFLESPDFEKAKDEKLISYDPFTMRMLTSVGSNKPHYSEIFMDTPFGVGVARLVVDKKFNYYIYTSDAGEYSKIEALVNTGMTYADAILKLSEGS